MTKSVLVICAHSDDEALGCGGTIARHAAEGDFVHLVFLADGVSSRLNGSIEEIEPRQEAANKAQNILGVKTTTYFDFPDNQLDSVPLLQLVKRIEDVIFAIKPEIVYTHHKGDLNVDHRITYQAVMTACRPVPGHSVREIYCFEVMSSSEWGGLSFEPFIPQLSIDISEYMEQKIAALQAYGLEMRDPPHSRSIEHVLALVRHRGYSVGVSAAESFTIMRVLR